MTDEILLKAFEDGTIALAAFGHREHVRVGWLLLGRYGRAEAERRVLDGLLSLAVRAGKPEKFNAPLTRAWLDAIETAATRAPHVSTFEALIAEHPDLLDARTVSGVSAQAATR
jgi:hypothetical protein